MKVFKAAVPGAPIFLLIIVFVGVFPCATNAGKDENIPYASLARKLIQEGGPGPGQFNCYVDTNLKLRLRDIYKMNQDKLGDVRSGTNPLSNKWLYVSFPRVFNQQELNNARSITFPNYERSPMQVAKELGPYNFLDYINKPTGNWYRVESMGTPGGWGASPLPGERIYVHIDDPVAWAPSWRNITSIATQRSYNDPVHRGESGIGLTLLHMSWGSGSAQKIIGMGGHDLKSYEQMAPPLRADTIRVHSQAGSALYEVYASGGWQSIERFRGKTILGAGVSPLDVGKNQLATGGYWSNFSGDVITRGLPWSLGLPFGNPLRTESTYGTLNTGFGRNYSELGYNCYVRQDLFKATQFGNSYLSGASNSMEFVQRMGTLQGMGYNIIGSPMNYNTYLFRYQPIAQPLPSIKTQPLPRIEPLK